MMNVVLNLWVPSVCLWQDVTREPEPTDSDDAFRATSVSSVSPCVNEGLEGPISSVKKHQEPESEKHTFISGRLNFEVLRGNFDTKIEKSTWNMVLFCRSLPFIICN